MCPQPDDAPFEPDGEDVLDQDALLDTDADLACPYCGETVTVALDPAGGATQEYVEDCEVCCRPWRVHVHFSDDGIAEVWAEVSD